MPENTKDGTEIGSLERAVGERKGTDLAQDVAAAHPIPSSLSGLGDAGSPRSTSSGSCAKPTRARGPARSVRCCAGSEAQFKTLKYRPGFPARFDSIEHARAFCRQFFAWYNGAHRHSGIGLMTPADVHHGRAEAVHADRARVLDAAYAATPERFVRRPPRPPALPTAAWINKPATDEAAAH
jgi:hypothetical protein